MLLEIKKLRKELHQYPELSGREFETAKRIQKFIELHYPTKIIENIGGTGLAAIYDFLEKGPVIAIRCELDALPIKEKNEVEYRSITEGVSHKCGHDGHMAIVAGLIFWIKKQNLKSGKIILLFQPAEETGEGANKVLEDSKFEELNIDYIFAMHNIPGEPLHNIITMDKGFSAEVQSFKISVKGKESHASEPQNGINPGLGIAEIIKEISQLENLNPFDKNFTVLTPIYINMGKRAYGISPANGELHYTIRTWSIEKMEVLKNKLNAIFSICCQAKKLEFEVEWFEYFPASKNNVIGNKYVLEAAKINNLTIIERSYPFRFGEDFGWFSRKYKTAMFGVGAGIDSPALHHANYDFPDELIETGINMFKEIIKKVFQDHNYDKINNEKVKV